MGGGLMQLVAYGAQDIYLTGNPQITFFKVVYRRHTNFSMESIKQNSNGTKVNFSTIISRNGDLVNNVYLEVTGNDYIRWGFTDFCSINSIVDTVELEIGGQLIDRQNGAIMDILGNLHKENPTGSPLTLYENKILRARYGNAQLSTQDKPIYNNTFNQKCWVPLHFWFCRYAGCALPLIALQYHEVKLNFKLYEDSASDRQGHIRLPTTEKVNLKDDEAQVNISAMNDIEVDVWADYVYLDTDERRRFAQVSHEYLIEQVQRQIHYPNVALHKDSTVPGKWKTMSNGRVDLTFNHPVKELIWTWVSTRPLTFDASKSDYKQLDRGYYTLLGSDINMDRHDFHDRYDKFKQDTQLFGSIIKDETMYQLKLNGHDRFAKMDANYFTRLQTWKHHSGGSLNRAVQWGDDATSLIPPTSRDEAIDAGALNSDYINVYSFALKPEEHQPSGTCNFSRIDTANLHYELRSKPYKVGKDPCCNIQDISLEVYAINYNVLRIMSGMGGLAYSN